MPASEATAEVKPPAAATHTGRLLFYFGLMYFCQGICQVVALINQPIRAYLKEQNYTADQSARFFFIATLPWVIKPVYGLVSDFIPLLGYRRRSYLMLVNLSAALAFLWMSGITDVTTLTVAAIIVGVGVAAADVIVDALMIEVGQRTGLVARFQSVQWMCIYGASILSGIASSLIMKYAGAPINAVRICAIICAVVPLGVAACTWWAVEEQRARLDVPHLKSAASGLLAAFKSPRLLFVVFFVALLAAKPAIGTPMNYHVTKVLNLSASFAALTDTFMAAGCVLGAGAFLALVANRCSVRKTLLIGILANAICLCAFFFTYGAWTAGSAYFIYGVGYQIGSLAMLTLAAQSCPRRAEGFVFAAMMSVYNYAYAQSDVWGGHLYEKTFAGHVIPVVAISLGIALVPLLILPLVPVNDARPKTAADSSSG